MSELFKSAKLQAEKRLITEGRVKRKLVLKLDYKLKRQIRELTFEELKVIYKEVCMEMKKKEII